MTFADRFETCGAMRRITELYLGLLSFLFLLLALSFLDGGSSLSGPYLCTLVPLRGDSSQVGTNNATLVLYSLSGPLLRNLFGDTLLVEASVRDGPRDLTGVLALQKQ